MACFIEDGQRQTALACAPILICGRQRRADNSGSSSVSPKLRDLYRKGAMNLEQLSAFAITEDHGSVRIERGFVRAEDEPESKPKDESKGKRPAKAADGLAPLSEKLVAELTAYRTSALRNELARHPGTALIALVHALALKTFFEGPKALAWRSRPRWRGCQAMRPALMRAWPRSRSRNAMPRGAGACRTRPKGCGLLCAAFRTRSGLSFLRIACG